jgi:hypothetical protein
MALTAMGARNPMKLPAMLVMPIKVPEKLEAMSMWLALNPE